MTQLFVGLTGLTGFALAGPTPGPDAGKASPVGLFIVVLLLIAVFLLVWSMNRHLKKLPESFDTGEPDPAQTPAPTPEADRTADGSGG